VSSINRKTLLVLAASLYQLEAIETAHRLGYRVVTTDNRPDNPGHALADRAYGADTCDLGAVLAIARAERITGVIAPCTDVALPTAAAVATQLGLAGPPTCSTRIVCDKAGFRDFQAAHGLPHPLFLKLESSDLLPGLEAAKQWIVKPCQSSGSKGIRVVSSLVELRYALPDAFGFSKSGAAIVEEFLPGHQGTCDGWLSAGRIAWHCLLDRQTVPLPFVATNGHRLPTTLPPTEQARVLDAIGEIWRRLGVTDGPFDCDFVVDAEAVFILELSPRLGGNSISQLVRLAYDFNLVEHTVRWACGDELGPLPVQPPRPSAVVILGADRAGALRYREDEAARLAHEPWVRSLTFDLPPGALVEPFTDGRRRVGQALLVADTRKDLDQRVAELRQTLAVTANQQE
jgi:biotin carboxylase